MRGLGGSGTCHLNRGVVAGAGLLALAHLRLMGGVFKPWSEITNDVGGVDSSLLIKKVSRSVCADAHHTQHIRIRAYA